MNLTGLNPFFSQGLGMGQNAVDNSSIMGRAQMMQIEATAAMQMRFQTEMGMIQMMVKLNEALAKLFKALGEAVKGLA